MRRETLGAATALSVSFLMAGGLPASHSIRSETRPAVDRDLISAALCGREEGRLLKLADALDDNPIALPAVWREMGADRLQPWLAAPPCPSPLPAELLLYSRRHWALEQIDRRLERAKATERLSATVLRFRGWRPASGPLPNRITCDGCTALQLSASQIAEVAALWPLQTDARLGTWLDVTAKREPLISRLCAARPSPDAGEELDRRFRYYTWTAAGARLLEVAAWWEQPAVSALCQDL